MLMSLVVPGLAPALAIFCPVRALMRLDFPTFERPTIAIVGPRSTGNLPPTGTLVRKSACEIFTGVWKA